MGAYKKALQFFVPVFVMSIFSIYAQDQTSGVSFNPVLHQQSNEDRLKSLKTGTDTLSLPFVDDFAYASQSAYPTNQKWLNNQAYINTNYSNDPVTIGICTFDALNAKGKLYAREDIRRGGDTLTSQPINLNDFFGYTKDSLASRKLTVKYSTDSFYSIADADSLYLKRNTEYHRLDTHQSFYYHQQDSLFTYNTSLNTYQSFTQSIYYYDSADLTYYRFPYMHGSYESGDSIYLSFYYQAGGLGDPPEDEDSLLVDFYNPVSGTWDQVFGVGGKTMQRFRPVFIPITDDKYLQKGFQFRFRNQISITGNDDVTGKRANVDHWHIDYVKLDQNRNRHDTLFKDIAFTTTTPSILKDYKAMPWQHYLQSSAYSNQKKNTIQVQYKNLNDQSITGEKDPFVYPRFAITNPDKNKPISTYDIGFNYMEPLELKSFEAEFLTNFTSNAKDSATFKLINSLETDDTAQYLKMNDTTKYIQRFHNYYAYDDGSAEAGYGIEGSNLEQARVAYRFHSYLEDTLKAVYFYFNYPFDSILRKSNFALTIWDDQNGKPGDTLYSRFSEGPPANEEYQPVHQGLNHYYPYYLDEPVVVEGDFYIGWIQKHNTFLNIGMDRNTNKSQHLYYNISGDWNNSPQKGALMIRPVFGDLPSKTGKKQIRSARDDLSIYPNPADQYVRIKKHGSVSSASIHYKLYNLNSKLLQQGTYRQPIPVSDFPSGMYILKLSISSKHVTTKKLLIQH